MESRKEFTELVVMNEFRSNKVGKLHTHYEREEKNVD